MFGSPFSAGTVLSGLLTLHVAAQPVCVPRIEIVEASLMDRGVIIAFRVDAHRCRHSHGTFELSLVRAKENAPDDTFLEAIAWSAPRTTVQIELVAGESIMDFWVHSIERCECRL